MRALEEWDVVTAAACPTNQAWVAKNSLDRVPVIAQYLTEHMECERNLYLFGGMNDNTVPEGWKVHSTLERWL